MTIFPLSRTASVGPMFEEGLSLQRVCEHSKWTMDALRRFSTSPPAIGVAGARGSLRDHHHHELGAGMMGDAGGRADVMSVVVTATVSSQPGGVDVKLLGESACGRGEERSPSGLGRPGLGGRGA